MTFSQPCMVHNCAATADDIWSSPPDRKWITEWHVCYYHRLRLVSGEDWAPSVEPEPHGQRWILLGNELQRVPQPTP
jgi:hypothetical protein